MGSGERCEAGDPRLLGDHYSLIVNDASERFCQEYFFGSDDRKLAYQIRKKYDSKNHNISSTLYIYDSYNYNIYIYIIQLNYINKVYPNDKAIWGVAYSFIQSFVYS